MTLTLDDGHLGFIPARYHGWTLRDWRYRKQMAHQAMRYAYAALRGGPRLVPDPSISYAPDLFPLEGDWDSVIPAGMVEKVYGSWTLGS
jgi:hypothetical protein